MMSWVPGWMACWLAIGSASCIFAESGRPSCSGDGFTPRCTEDGRLEQCLGGQVFREDCSEGTVCLQGGAEANQPWAQCVQAGAQFCDTGSFVPGCRGGLSVVVCVPPGFTRAIDCDSGQVCKTTPVRAACASPDAEPCDPETFQEHCDGNQRAWCDTEFGFVGHEEPCPDPSVCRQGANGPVCVAPDARPCEWKTYHSTCQGDAVLDCDPLRAFTEIRPCQAQERCRQSDSAARCFGADQPDCDRAGFVSYCRDNSQVVCNIYGVEEATGCSPDRACRLSSVGAFCVDPAAEVCDPQHFEVGCAGTDQILCGFNGFTFHVACDTGLVCVMDVGPLGTAPACVDPSWPSCSDTAPVTCDGSYSVQCIGGYVKRESCPGDQVCATDGVWAGCFPADTPSCDPATFTSHCEADEVVLCWEPGRIVRWPCSDPYQCVESPEGPTCQESP